MLNKEEMKKYFDDKDGVEDIKETVDHLIKRNQQKTKQRSIAIVIVMMVIIGLLYFLFR